MAVLLVAAAPAGASFGPSFGGQGFQPREDGASRITGWEVGLAAFGPQGQGFWHFGYGRAANKEGTVRLTSMAGRLSFRIAGGQAVYLYAGGGFARDERKAEVVRKAWLGSVHAGILMNPARFVEACWSNFPCFPCLTGSNTTDCATCLQQRNSQRSGADLGPGSPRSLNIGIDGGLRFAGPKGFNGYDARAFVLIVL
jgi:hypothetical protein